MKKIIKHLKKVALKLGQEKIKASVDKQVLQEQNQDLKNQI